MARTLACFKEWVDEGAGGAIGWTLEAENYEGWRVTVDEGTRIVIRRDLNAALMIVHCTVTYICLKYR